MKRWLEVNTETGIAFHEPGQTSPFSTEQMDPPIEILFCDCRGVGLICHHTYLENEVSIHGHLVEEETQDSWKQRHRGTKCHHRRQIFVDVTHRPDAQLGMKYDEKADSFSKV